MSFKYHGNYCGPGWSGGKWQGSIPYGEGPDAIDEFDETCRIHDDAYATGKDLRNADFKFARDNMKSFNLKRIAAGLAVGIQGSLRKKTMPPIKRRRLNSNDPNRNTPQSLPRNPSETIINQQDISNPFLDIATAADEESAMILATMADTYKENKMSGQIGSYHKYAINKNHFSAKHAQIHGSSIQYENGIISGSPTVKVLYLLCGTPATEMIDSVFRAMVTVLLHKHGIHFKNFETALGLNGRVRIYYRNKNAGAISTIGSIFTDAATVRQIANTWKNAFQNDASVDVGLNAFDFYKIRLDIQVEAVPQTWEMAAELYTESLEIHMQQSFKMVCQNQTAADVEAGNNTDLSNVNPVLCKTFYINGPNVTVKTNDFGTNPGLILVPNIISGFYNYATTTTSGPNPLTKLPQSHIFERVAKTLKPVNVIPGHMVERNLSKHFSMGLNHMFSLLADIRGTSDDDVWSLGRLQTEFGCSLLMAFEKTLHTRGAETPGVSIGTQWEYFISSYISKKSMKPTNKIVNDQ